MKEVFVDTSAWYSFLNRKDLHHTPIVKYFEDTSFKFLTSNFVLAELLNLLVARRQKKLAIEFGKQLRTEGEVQIVPIMDPQENRAWSLFQKYADHDFSYTDYTSFALMEQLKIKTVLALDDDFTKMGFERIP